MVERSGWRLPGARPDKFVLEVGEVLGEGRFDLQFLDERQEVVKRADRFDRL